MNLTRICTVANFVFANLTEEKMNACLSSWFQKSFAPLIRPPSLLHRSLLLCTYYFTQQPQERSCFMLRPNGKRNYSDLVHFYDNEQRQICKVMHPYKNKTEKIAVLWFHSWVRYSQHHSCHSIP